MRFKRKETQDTAIDISPLMDVTFLLLIFFMVSATFTHDLQVDLSRPGAQQVTESNTKSIKVFIDQKQQTYIDGQPIRPWVIQNKVRELIAQGASKSLLIVTDKNVSAEKLIEVVDQCRLGGAVDVGVAADHEA